MSDQTDLRFTIIERFTKAHERALTLYLQDDRRLTTDLWQLLYEAIEFLGQSEVYLDTERYTFRQLYNRHIDQALADEYIEQLLRLADVAAQGPMLAATFARQIGSILEQAQLLSKQNPQSYLFFAYCVYWWQSFARGYAFEIEIKRDLENDKIAFAMHDILNRSERYSPADLIVLGLLGDIKTSTYFLHEAVDGSLTNDFYITRLYTQGRSRTLVVFQKTPAWDRIGGTRAIPGNLDNILALLPQAVQLEQGNTTLIVVDYTTWKAMIQRMQADEGV